MKWVGTMTTKVVGSHYDLLIRCTELLRQEKHRELGVRHNLLLPNSPFAAD
jgi:hypothetical protein